MASTKVDFPAPFGPMSPMIEAAGTVNETSSRALSAPNCTVSPSTVSTGAPSRAASSTVAVVVVVIAVASVPASGGAP